MPDINGTQYQIYQLQRPNAGLYQYLNLKITSNMRLTPPCLDQNANYNATAHNSWQINNSFQFSIPISLVSPSFTTNKNVALDINLDKSCVTQLLK